MTETMRAMVVRAWGDPSVLIHSEVPRPIPGPTEILVRVRAAGVNPVDWKTRAGGGMAFVLGDPAARPEDQPVILGWDVAGVVEAVGFGVTRFVPGDRVFGMPRFPHQAGAYAEYVTAPSRQFARIPDGLSDVDAAALPLAGLTAWQSLVQTAQVAAGSTVLVAGAAGGVGHLAVQIAKASGATVIGTARAAKHDLLRSLGADELVDHTTTAFEETVKDVDVALDAVGGENSLRAVQTLAPGGLLISVPGGVSQEVAAAAESTGRRATGILVEPDSAGIEALASLVAAGQLRPVVARTFPLAEAAAAHDLGVQGHVTGKLVLTVD